MCMHEQWQLHYTSQWGQQTPLSQHVYCVAVTFKRTEQVEQWICIQFCIKLEHPSTETTGMIQKAAAMGNWRSADSSQQHTYACIRCRDFWPSNHPSDSGSLQPIFGALWLLAFPKLKSPLKGKGFQIIYEIQENMTGQLMVIERAVWGTKVPTLKGTEAPLYYVQCFLYLVSSSGNVSFCIVHGWIFSEHISHITTIFLRCLWQKS